MSFDVSGDAYDRFMGRYSRELAPAFADFARRRRGPARAGRRLRLGCPDRGARPPRRARKTWPASIPRRCSTPAPSAYRAPTSAAARPRSCRGTTTSSTLRSRSWSCTSWPIRPPASGEMARVTRPGGTVAACTWDFGEGMQLLRTFWQSARALDPEADAETSPFGQREQLDALWRGAGLEQVETEALEVSSQLRKLRRALGLLPARRRARRGSIWSRCRRSGRKRFVTSTSAASASPVAASTRRRGPGPSAGTFPAEASLGSGERLERARREHALPLGAGADQRDRHLELALDELDVACAPSPAARRCSVTSSSGSCQPGSVS